MKNIHVLPTDKPSRLLFNHILKSFCFQKEENGMFINDGKVNGASFWSIEKAENNGFYPQNIYITSDKKIKVSEWGLNKHEGTIVKCNKSNCTSIQEHWDRIILTTDQDLIKDGVQGIDDDFLEWFVKNPSCEEVETIITNEINVCINNAKPHYKIIIPKEEPKQETLEEFISKSDTPNGLDQFSYDKGLEDGAKWQAQKMYSEEEVYDIVQKAIEENKSKQLHFFDGGFSNPIYTNLKKWFEQFKKK